MDKPEILRRLERLRIRTRSLDVIELADILRAMAIQASPTKAAIPRKTGRPRLFEHALTPAERARRYRQRLRDARQ